MYKHVIYKKCRPFAIVQYEQHILQRNAKKKGKKSGLKYKLGGIGDDYSPFKI